MHLRGSVLIALAAFATATFADMKSAAVKHPVMPVPSASAASLQAKVDPLLERGMDFILDLVPDRNGIRFCECPNCDQGTQAGQIAWNGIDDPDGVHCRFCGHQYPSEKYPMDRVLRFKNRRGEEVEWRYYESPDGEPHYFDARARAERKAYVGRLAQDLADLYVATGEDRYADAGAQLLYHISQRYAGWCFVLDRVTGKDGPMPDAEPPYEYWGGIWSRWFYGDAPAHVALAYDRLYESGAFERLGAQLGLDVKQAIEQDMLHASIEFLRTYKEYYGNMSPIIYRSLIEYGRILNEPDYVHDGIQRAADLIRNELFFDGLWQKGSGAKERQKIGLLSDVFTAARGYSDPPGYSHPDTGVRFDNLDMETDLPFTRKAIAAVSVLAFPDGKAVAIHDDWAGSGRKPTERNTPELLSGMGHARLARGEDATAMQAHLHFSGGYGHQHADNLSLVLWAKGRELLSDIGYTHSAWRTWTTRTPAHNTVTVNVTDQVSRGTGGNLTLYAPVSDDLQVVEAQALVAYPDVASEYRRRVVVVGVSPADAYVLDIFRVAGGTRHDYVLHGSADDDQTATLSLPTEPLAGSLLGPDAVVRLPRGESDSGEFPDGISPAYAFIKDLQKAETEDDWSIQFAMADDPEIQLRTTVLSQPDTTLYQVMSPSIRRAKENDAELDKYYMPGVIARRDGADGLASVYVAIHEPYVGRRFVQSVTSLLQPPDGDVAAPVALAVAHEAGTDYIMSSPPEGGAEMSVQIAGEEFTCDSRLGIQRLRDGQPIMAYQCDGPTLRYGDFSMQTDTPSFSGKILGVQRDEAAGRFAFVVDGQLPSGDVMAGQWAIVTHGDGTTHGYEIAGAELQGDGSILHLADDPGFTLADDGTTQFLYFPRNTIEGDNSFRINSQILLKVE